MKDKVLSKEEKAEEEIEENIRRYIKEHSTTIKAYTQEYVDKKDKVINNLLKRISDLEFEVERLDKVVKVKDEGFKASTEDLCEESTKIDKAIEYINSAIENDDIEELKSARHLLLYNEDLDNLLDILKGVDKEWF